VSIKQRDHIVWHRLNALTRSGLVRGLGKGFADHCLVNEYPKSGGSWAAQLLSDALGLPFPRNRLPMLQSSILHGHYMIASPLDMKVVFWRDGRDVAVSWYYHYVFGVDKASQRAVEFVRRDAGIDDPENVEVSFLPALDYFLTRSRYPRFTWAAFVDRWATDASCVHVRYEDLHTDTVGELRRMVNSLTGADLPVEDARAIVDKYSFRRQSGREQGQLNKKSYLRKGIVGDWRNHFSKEARDLFNHKAGAQLIRLGYEPDESWVAGKA